MATGFLQIWRSDIAPRAARLARFGPREFAKARPRLVVSFPSRISEIAAKPPAVRRFPYRALPASAAIGIRLRGMTLLDASHRRSDPAPIGANF